MAETIARAYIGQGVELQIDHHVLDKPRSHGASCWRVWLVEKGQQTRCYGEARAWEAIIPIFEFALRNAFERRCVMLTQGEGAK